MAAPERTRPGVAGPEGPGEQWSWPQIWEPSWKARQGKLVATWRCRLLLSWTRHFTVRDEGPAPGLGLGCGAPARQPCQENAFFSLPLPLLPRGSFRSLNALRKRKKKGNLLGTSLVSARRWCSANKRQTQHKLSLKIIHFNCGDIKCREKK